MTGCRCLPVQEGSGLVEPVGGDRLPVGFQRVAGEVDPQRLPFPLQLFLVGVFGDFRRDGRFRLRELHRRKEVQLPAGGEFPLALAGGDHRFGAGIEPLPGAAETVQRPGVDHPLHRPPGQLPPPQPGAEVEKAPIRPVFLPLFDELFGEGPADPLDAGEAEPDALPLGRETGLALIDVRRVDRDAGGLRRVDILRHFGHMPDDRGHQRREIGLGVVAFEVGGLVGDDRVGGGVGLVEGVLGEGRHLVEDGVGGRLRDAVRDSAGDGGGAVGGVFPVDEDLPLGLHDLHLLFAHRFPHQVRPPVGVACQRPADLHHLFLVEEAAAGGGEDRPQKRVEVADILRVLPVVDKGGD